MNRAPKVSHEHCFCTKSARIGFQKLSLKPQRKFFALFSKMKVLGPESFILSSFLGIFIAGRPAGRPGRPAGPAGPVGSVRGP